jgi:hypothetical protein
VVEKHGTMDKVQKIDRNNTPPSSKTFRDELISAACKVGVTLD